MSYKSIKSGITYAVFYNYAKIIVDSYNSLPLELTLAFLNVITPIKAVFPKDKKNDFYNIFLEKCSNK